MIRFTVTRMNFSGDSLEGMVEGRLSPIKPRLDEPSSEPFVDVSAEEAIAITLIDIKRTLSRILQKLEVAYPSED